MRIRIGHTRLTHGYHLVGRRRPTCGLYGDLLTADHIICEYPQLQTTKQMFGLKGDPKEMLRENKNFNKAQNVMKKCIDLVSLDYNHVLVDNSGGDLCAHYPSQLIFMEYEKVDKKDELQCELDTPLKSTDDEALHEKALDPTKLKDLIMKARPARCRARFPLPVIVYKGKNICRSSTLSGGPEMYSRHNYDYFFSYDDSTGNDESNDQSLSIVSQSSHLFNKIRNLDIRLLRTWNVGAIIDFMVEKKKVKFGLNVTSSEKVDKENRYNDFTIMSLPYPGCEFFKSFRDNNYTGEGLIFDWSQTHVDAEILIPNDPVSRKLKIEWEDYKMWDLIKLTENYVKLTLRYLVDQPLGLLIHCISGWDRTPLFISLIRLSLWADGAIHKSLSPAQILYFTIAYDWMLFGHNLYDRLYKGEDIFLFCFYFLKFIYKKDFSIIGLTKDNTPEKNNSVSKTDSEGMIDGVLLDSDVQISSQASNVSAHSSWSSISSKSHDAPPSIFQAEGLSGSCSSISVLSNMSCENSKVDSTNMSSASIDLPLGNCLPLNSKSSSNGSLDKGFESPMSSGSDQKLSMSQESNGKTNSLMSRSASNRTSPVPVPIPANVRTRNESSSSVSLGSWQFVSGTGSFRGSASNSSSEYPRSTSSVNDNATMQDSTATLTGDDSFIYNNNAECFKRRCDRLKSVRNLFYNCYCPSVGIKLKDGSESKGLRNFMGSFAEKVGIISAQKAPV